MSLHTGDILPPPISTTVNITNKTSWALGMKVEPLFETDDARDMKIHLGYMAAKYMNLVSNDHMSGDPNIDSSFVMNQSEVKMKIDEPLVANPTLLDKFKTCSGEKGILTLITQQRIIRRAYLNNRLIPAQVDTCSLVSVVKSSDPKFNRILKVGRKIGMRPLH